MNSHHRIATRPPRGELGEPVIYTDADHLAGHLEDAAHFPGGRASGIAFPSTEGEIAALLRRGTPVLPIGAQSSLTGGATPMGELLLSTARLDRLEIGADAARVGPGVTLQALEDALESRGLWYPPASTYPGAFVGGTVATNAAGANTFKYGTTRDWVAAMTVVLPNGEVLDLERGRTLAHPDGFFEVRTAAGELIVPVPSYTNPAVPKRAAGYHAAPGMDLIDLFIGSEGTLGVISAITLRVVPLRPACWLLVPCRTESQGLQVARALREASLRTWQSGDPLGVDVAAIEHLDRRSLDLVREDGVDRTHQLSIPPETELLLLVQLELPADHAAAGVLYDQIQRARDPDAPDTPIVRACRLLDEAGVLEGAEIAAPDNRRRSRQFLALREAVPASVNLRVGRAKSLIDRRIQKVAADMIAPFERVADMLAVYRRAFGARGLDYAIWGHLSDGNVHPNVLPRSLADVAAGCPRTRPASTSRTRHVRGMILV